MTQDEKLQAYAQNGEDVVLWRALKDIPQGRYVDVGANDPTWFSISRAFYDHGWRGITIEPMPSCARAHREQRPGDILVEAAISSTGGQTVMLHEVPDTGLSTLIDDISDRYAEDGREVVEVPVQTRTLNDVLDEAGWDGLDIHFMTVDVEGAEGDVLASIDLGRWRPWVLVIESTAPLSTRQTHSTWEKPVVDAGYQFCFFDGLSRFYVADEHAERLRANLSYPACLFDDYESNEQRAMAGRLAAATEDAIRWRGVALTRWSEAVSSQTSVVEALNARVIHLQEEIERLHNTVSWRVTAPIRAARRQPGRPRWES